MTREKSDRVLVHVCCAVCYVGVALDLREKGVQFGGVFYNPNVHPLVEYRKRLTACQVAADMLNLPLSVQDEYGLVEWLRGVVGREESRCEYCYRVRLQRTARLAVEGGFARFTTTLLAGPQQKHELIRAVGEEVSRLVGVEFWYRDWRGVEEGARTLARKHSLYRQQYCGCIYSEHERYKDTKEHLWRRPGEGSSI